MKERINKIIHDYKLDVESVHSSAQENAVFQAAISTGTNEGYYVTVSGGIESHSMRTHSRDEALKILGCMLILLPANQ